MAIHHQIDKPANQRQGYQSADAQRDCRKYKDSSVVSAQLSDYQIRKVMTYQIVFT